MPEEGMPLRALQYTTLGEPDEKVLCRDYDKMDENHKQITVRWYRKDGNLLASGLCFQLKSEQEMMLHSFSYFDPEDDADTDSVKDTPSRQSRGKGFAKTTTIRRICGKITRKTTMMKTKPGTSGMTTGTSRMMADGRLIRRSEKRN